MSGPLHSSTTVATFLTFGLSAVAAGYFASRFLLHGRRWTSLALVPMCLGWFVAAALMNGDVPPEAYDVVRWICVLVTLIMVVAIFGVELREMPTRRR